MERRNFLKSLLPGAGAALPLRAACVRSDGRTGYTRTQKITTS